MFLFAPVCGAVISIDTGDMLPLKPFVAPAVAAANAHGFAAAPLCTKPYYFNAGFFAIGRPYLVPDTARALFRQLVLIARRVCVSTHPLNTNARRVRVHHRHRLRHAAVDARSENSPRHNQRLIDRRKLRGKARARAIARVNAKLLYPQRPRARQAQGLPAGG
jgi:hypothetical protein